MRNIFILALVFAGAHASPCRYASEFQADDLLSSQATRDNFLSTAINWESKFFFGPGVGFNGNSGITYDGHPINYDSGELASTPHNFSASSKESLHLNILTHALAGNFAKYNYNVATDVVVDVLTKKISSYELFNQQYPGFGGFLPWVWVTDNGCFPDDGWENRTPGLDNGQLAWAIYGLIAVLNQNSNLTQLASRYQAQWELMKKNCVPVFYDGQGRVRAVARILNVNSTNIVASNYIDDGIGFLDDPYEGELMTFLMDLYGTWPNPFERELLWVYKRKAGMLAAVDYPSSLGLITVQKGFWYSAHEQWKFMVLPYRDIDLINRIFINCERARTRHSADMKIPGLFASINDVANHSLIIPTYISATGIQQVAFEEVLRKDVITPYGSFPTIMANQSVGLVWYHNMLLGPRMQGPFGSTEACNVNGTEISPLTTWDSKITTVAAMMGGISDVTRDALKADGKYARFHQLASTMYAQVFSNLKGEDIAFGMPVNQAPLNSLGYFSSCPAN